MPPRPRWIWLLITAAVVFAGVFWFGRLDQPLIDRHEFRQTQTALSALFMQPGLEGLLNYQTPAVGAPWSIPFEFPLFQWIAHQLAHLSGLNLSSSGRLVSVLFGLGCLWPATRLLRRFGLSFVAVGLFIALYCTSSIYLFWNRAFLMESTALFFTLVSLDLYSQLRPAAARKADAAQPFGLLSIAFGISLSLGLLVKATTALPALMLMGGDWIWQSKRALTNQQWRVPQLLLGGAMAVAFAVLYGWTHHADALKQLNPIGSQLTSTALRAWNFGQASQRLQPELWRDVVLQRMLTPLAALPITALLIGGLWISSRSVKTFLLACLLLSVAPLLIFTNLHIAHSYYQASNQIFLLMAVAASGASLLDQARQQRVQKGIVIMALTVVIIANLNSFFSNDWPRIQRKSSDKLAIGKLIQKNTPTNSGILVFGDDWSSAFAYHSQKRAYTKPDWPNLDSSETSVIQDIDQRLGGIPLGAVVSKTALDPTILGTRCKINDIRVIKRWHVYMCDVVNAPQP